MDIRSARNEEESYVAIMEYYGCYDEGEIERIVREKSLPRNRAMEQLLLLNEKESEDLDIAIAHEIFARHLPDRIEDFLYSFSPEVKEKFLSLSHFYFFWCIRPSNNGDVFDQSFVLIIITSIIEAIMSDFSHQEFIEWFRHECKKTKLEDYPGEELQDVVELLWKEYKEVYGANKKVRRFFNEYVSSDDKKKLKRGFKKATGEYASLDEVAKFLYEMRSKFVHEAEIVNLPPKYGLQLDHVGGKSLILKISIGEIQSIFEKAFVGYYLGKVDTL